MKSTRLKAAMEAKHTPPPRPLRSVSRRRAPPLTVDVFVPPPHEQRPQQQQQQADAHAAHDEARVVLLLGQHQNAQVLDGVRLPPLKEGGQRATGWSAGS